MEIVKPDSIPHTLDISVQDLLETKSEQLREYCKYLIDVCDKYQGQGISAVQVGIPWNLFMIKGDGTCPLITKDSYGIFYNCSYKPAGEKVERIEGCLSLVKENGESQLYSLNRFKRVLVQGYQIQLGENIVCKKIKEKLFIFQQGDVFQHEIDHQNGILISEIGSKHE